MINEIEEVQWSYLLDPAFELTNTAGKPLTDGYIEVYIHGTRNKYYCAMDFDGTLHPFKIPLDSLGANIVLASPAHAYDVYVYNKFGSLVMSRYNVQPKLGSGEITHDDITVSSNDGSVQIVTSGQTNYDLSIQDTIDRVDVVESSITNIATSVNEITNVVTGHDIDIEELKANKKDKQEEYVVEGTVTQTITRIEQDENGKLNVTYSDIDLPSQVPNVELTSPNGTINIASSVDIATNTKTFEIDIDGHEPEWHYWTDNNSWTNITNSSWKDINRPNAGSGSSPHSWLPEIKIGVYDAKADFSVTFHNPDNTLTVPNQIIQIGFRAKLVGKNNADAIKYIDLGAWTYDPSLYTTEPYQYNFAQESIRQNYSTSKIFNVPNYIGDTEFYIYYQAALFNTDGGVSTPQPIDPICKVEITYFGMHEVVSAVNGNGTGSNLMPGSGISIDEDRINVNVGEGLSIVNNNVSIDKSVVLSKDNLVAGDNITITASGDNFIISSDGELATKSDLASAIELIEAEIPSNTSDLNNDSGFITSADIANLATKTELSSAVDVLASGIDVLQTEINNIPAQVQANWNEADQSSKAYIQNKPSIPTKTSDLNNDSGYITSSALNSYIPYSASGVDLPNSNFEIDVNGQAYKKVLNKPNVEYYNGTAYITTVVPTTTYYATLPNSVTQILVSLNETVLGTKTVTNGKVDFMIPPNTQGDYIKINATNYYPLDDTNSSFLYLDKSKYVLEDELASAVNDIASAIPDFNGASGINITDDTISLDDPMYVKAGNGITITATGDDIIISANGGGGASYTAGDGIDITNDVISVDNTIARTSELTSLATKTELGSAIDELASGIDVLQTEINDIPAQVQSDWSEDDTSSKAYIQNKPVEKVLIAGNNVSITDIGSAIEISSTGGGGSQVQADWTEDDSSEPSYIQNKPTEKNLVAGTNVTITETNDDVIVNTTEIASGAELVAGSGINIEEVGNTIRISNDETVLWSGTFSGSTGSSNYITLSEATTNFETIEITMGGDYLTKLRYSGAATKWQVFSPFVDGATNSVIYAGMYIVTNNGTHVYSNPWLTINSNSWTADTDMNIGEQQMTKVVGINRIGA